MKKIITAIFALSLVLSACGPHGIDLEQLTFKEDVNALIKDRKTITDDQEPLTTLPGYSLRDVEGYHFGSVEIPQRCNIEFLLDPAAGKKLCGFVIDFKTDISSKQLNSYLKKKYPKPTKVLQKEKLEYDRETKAYLGNAAYLWSNIKPGYSMILYNSHGVVNGAPLLEATVWIIKNDTKIAAPGATFTALDRLIGSYMQTQ